MKKLLIKTLLIPFSFFYLNISAQDHLNFTALSAEGYGVYAYNVGHAIPDDPCDNLPNAVAFYSLSSPDLAPPAQFSNMKAALKLAAGGVGFATFTAALTTHGYSLADVEMKFTPIDLGDDTEHQDWFKIDEVETRFYYDGNFTFYVSGQPIVDGTMPVFKLEIDYNDNADCTDDVIFSETQYTSVSDASAGQPADVQAIAAAFLVDMGSNGIRFTFSQMQPAIVFPNQYVFESATGKIEIGGEFDDQSAVTIDNPAAGVCTTPSATVTSTASGNWLHILNGGNRVASILDTENMGLMTTEFYVNSGAVRTTSTSLQYMDRNFKITPAVQPANPVKVRLYFTDAEWEDFSAMLPTDLNAMSDISITKFDASDCDEIDNATGEIDLAIIDYGYIPFDAAYYLDVEVASFSSFFVHGPKDESILPVELISFEGETTQKGVNLNWSTASEINNQGFEVQRSADGTNWSNIGWVNGNGSTINLQNYSFLDVEVSTQGLWYYRLKQMDFDGTFEFSPTISIRMDDNKRVMGEIFPNPSQSQEVQINYSTDIEEDISVRFFDVAGKLVGQQIYTSVRGSNRLTFDVSQLVNGIYLVEMDTQQGRIHRKLIVEK